MRLVRFASVVLCCIVAGGAVAEEQARPPGSSEAGSVFSDARALLMLGYQRLSLRGGGTFDLFGIHYLHQLNDWLYLGLGANGPVAEGHYGGFFTLDATAHVKKRLLGNVYGDAGVAVGGGGGGTRVGSIDEISGSGRYIKTYVGLDYRIDDMYLGLGYADVRMPRSPIDDASLEVIFQKPITFSVAPFADAGRVVASDRAYHRAHESIVSLEATRLSQIDPKGYYGGDIRLVSPQFSQFVSDDYYVFFAFDLGYSGLDWYNQIHGGVGRRVPLSPSINWYGQLGIGTGGWVTDAIDTGAGLLIYPKTRLEYVWGNGIGLSLAGGYLAAPTGTSRNWTVGAGVDCHFDPDDVGARGGDHDRAISLDGVRCSLFYSRLFDVRHNQYRINDIDMANVRLDCLLGDHVYVPVQIGAAANDYAGFAGYTEMFVGLGVQNRYLDSRRLQGFVQLLYGINDVGVIPALDVGPLVNASIGCNYGLTERVALYAQAGETVAVNHYLDPSSEKYFRCACLGLGVTIRFSVPRAVPATQ